MDSGEEEEEEKRSNSTGGRTERKKEWEEKTPVGDVFYIPTYLPDLGR